MPENVRMAQFDRERGLVLHRVGERRTRLMVERVVDAIVTVVRRQGAAHAHLERDTRFVIPADKRRPRSAADKEAVVGAVAGLHAGGHSGAGVLAQVVGYDATHGRLGHQHWRLLLAHRQAILQGLHLLLFASQQGADLVHVVGAGRAAAGQSGHQNQSCSCVRRSQPSTPGRKPARRRPPAAGLPPW